MLLLKKYKPVKNVSFLLCNPVIIPIVSVFLHRLDLITVTTLSFFNPSLRDYGLEIHTSSSKLHVCIDNTIVPV